MYANYIAFSFSMYKKTSTTIKFRTLFQWPFVCEHQCIENFFLEKILIFNRHHHIIYNLVFVQTILANNDGKHVIKKLIPLEIFRAFTTSYEIAINATTVMVIHSI